MPGMVFWDTWSWLALGRRRDSRHGHVRALYRRLRKGGARLCTSDYVLDETITLLFRRELFAEAVSFGEALFAPAASGALLVERINAARFAEAWRLRRKLDDKPLVSFTDLTTMSLVRELGIEEIVSADDHFRHVGMNLRLLP